MDGIEDRHRLYSVDLDVRNKSSYSDEWDRRLSFHFTLSEKDMALIMEIVKRNIVEV